MLLVPALCLPRGPPAPLALDGSAVSLLLADRRLRLEKALWLRAAGSPVEPDEQLKLGQFSCSVSFCLLLTGSLDYFPHQFQALFYVVKSSILPGLSSLIWFMYICIYFPSSLRGRYIILSKVNFWHFKGMSDVLGSSSRQAYKGACWVLSLLPFPWTFSCFILTFPFSKLGLLSSALKVVSIFSIKWNFYFILLTLPNIIPFLPSVGFFERMVSFNSTHEFPQ